MTTTTVTTLADYAAYKEHITHTTIYQGEEKLKPGDTIRQEDVKLVTLVDGVDGKKLKASSVLRAGATVYEYVTAKDKVKGTVSRYAKTSDIVDGDILKSYKQLMNDITTKLMAGNISPDQALAAINDLKTAQANQSA